MLIRISLIVAILAALGVGTLGYLEVSQQIPSLKDQRDKENTLKHARMDELSKTNKLLVQTKITLAKTQQDLADTQQQRDKAIADASVQTKRANDLNDKLATAIKDRDAANDGLSAYKVTGLTPDQVIKLSHDLTESQNTVAALNAEAAKLNRTIARQKYELDQLVNPDTAVKLPADLQGTIVVVDPKWQFVVVNVGEDQGVIQNGELLVSRDGKLVSKVIVRSVEKDRSIANVVPGWNFGPVVEGDHVTPAHPAPAS
jgi:hypothetical protein